MSSFGGGQQRSSSRRKQSPLMTLLSVIALIVVGLQFADQAKRNAQPPAKQNVPPRQEAPKPSPTAQSSSPGPAPSPSASRQGEREAVHVVRVVDGDTLLLERGVRVRFLGVNTPEIAHDDQPEEPFGPEAKEFTRKFLEGRPVELEYDQERTDMYGRTLAYVYADGRMLNEALIEAGLSEAVTRHPYRSDRKRLFEAAEKRAYEKKLGIWSQPGRKPR